MKRKYQSITATGLCVLNSDLLQVVLSFLRGSSTIFVFRCVNHSMFRHVMARYLSSILSKSHDFMTLLGPVQQERAIGYCAQAAQTVRLDALTCGKVFDAHTLSAAPKLSTVFPELGEPRRELMNIGACKYLRVRWARVIETLYLLSGSNLATYRRNERAFHTRLATLRDGDNGWYQPDGRWLWRKVENRDMHIADLIARVLLTNGVRNARHAFRWITKLFVAAHGTSGVRCLIAMCGLLHTDHMFNRMPVPLDQLYQFIYTGLEDSGIANRLCQGSEFTCDCKQMRTGFAGI